jgi:hypothetical protein
MLGSDASETASAGALDDGLEIDRRVARSPRLLEGALRFFLICAGLNPIFLNSSAALASAF